MMVKIGELYKSVDYGYVVEVVNHYEDGHILEIVEHDDLDKIGRTLHTAKDWPGRWAAKWTRIPSKSDNFNTLYEKLNGK